MQTAIPLSRPGRVTSEARCVASKGDTMEFPNRTCPRTGAPALRRRTVKKSCPGSTSVCYNVVSKCLAAHYNRMGSTMRESVIAFCTVTAATTLIGATLFASSGAQAIPLAGPSGLKTAIHQATATQKVHDTCRRGSHGRKCYHVSRPDRNLRYYRPYAYDPTPPYSGGGPSWNQPPLGPFYTWGSGALK
jgi:hypothetical protein